MNTVDIFIKSYGKDYKLLHYAIKSILKNVTGWRKIILLTPDSDKLDYTFDDTIEHFKVHEEGNGYLFQQWCKISAHRYSDAKFIMFADSDCIFDKPLNLQDLVKGGKPEILYTSYDKVGEAICWKKPTEDFIKEPVEFEFMRRNCMIYRTSTLRAIAEYEQNLKHNILTADKFSEFNAMGAFAFKYERENYTFVNTDNWEYTEPFHIQLWSWAEKGNGNPPHPEEWAKIVRVIKEVFNEDLK